MLKQILSSINCLRPLLIKVSNSQKNVSGDSCSQIRDFEGPCGEQKLKS